MCPFIELGLLKISTFYIFVSLGMIVSVFYFVCTFKGTLEEYRHSIYSFVVSLLFAGVGAKLLYGLTVYLKTGILEFSGAVFYGGIIGASIGLILYTKLNHLPFLKYSDVFLGIVPLGHAIARIGCYFNGCCYGKVIDTFISVDYIVNGEMVHVIPTWFIESVFCILLFFFLKTVSNKTGAITSFYFMMYGTYRFIIEFFRGDMIRGVWGYISTSQIISVFIIIVGIYLWIRGGISYDYK